jgi:hypothetical protein
MVIHYWYGKMCGWIEILGRYEPLNKCCEEKYPEKIENCEASVVL